MAVAMRVCGYGEIIIAGDYESASVYDLSGREMPSLSVISSMSTAPPRRSP